MREYNFYIDTYEIAVKVDTPNDYHINIDSVYAGRIYYELIVGNQPIWKTKDLIPEDLVQKIGSAIYSFDVDFNSLK